MSECTHDCSNCSANCSSREQKSMIESPNKLAKIKKVIGVVSGKGGVGKSLITSLLAVEMQRKGYKTAILDSDITGPSIPKMFGLKEKAEGCQDGILPVITKTGIRTMSINLLLENDTDPVVWRGPVIAGTVKQFWTDVCWGEVDYMFVDMPPGTGDVALTVFQSLPIDGIIIVSSPQELVSMIVEKAVKMTELMNIPVLGLVENMSYVKCPHCDEKFYVFGESKVDEVAKEHGLSVLGKIPFDRTLAGGCDSGLIELFEGDWLKSAVDKIENL